MRRAGLEPDLTKLLLALDELSMVADALVHLGPKGSPRLLDKLLRQAAALEERADAAEDAAAYCRWPEGAMRTAVDRLLSGYRSRIAAGNAVRSALGRHVSIPPLQQAS